MAPKRAMKAKGERKGATPVGEIYSQIESVTGIKKVKVKAVFEALAVIAPECMKKAKSGSFLLPNIVNLKKKVKPARKAGKAMAFGKEVIVSAKPAKTVVKGFAVKALKAKFM